MVSVDVTMMAIKIRRTRNVLQPKLLQTLPIQLLHIISHVYVDFCLHKQLVEPIHPLVIETTQHFIHRPRYLFSK